MDGGDDMNNRDRILAVARGQMVDVWPYAPRIDLWHSANLRAGTIPREHEGRSIAEICAAEGWGSHHLVPRFLRRGQQPHRALGLYDLPEQPYKWSFGPDVAVETTEEGDFTTQAYRTNKGTVRTKTMYTEEMKASGASITWIDEHVLKGPADYEVVAHIFENIEVRPNYEEFLAWRESEVGDNGIEAAFASLASSPIHHVQKEFLDATDFYFHYNDNVGPMARLREGLSVFYDKVFKVILDSPADVILWGANFDDMITYPSYFVKEIQPWLRKVGPAFRARDKVCVCHCDGENFGLMDILPDSGFQVAEAICPWPMTKVKIGEYYRRWRDRLAIFGGIPSNILLDDLTSEADFEGYLDSMFKELAPGDKLIVGIADTTPPLANWDRLRRVGDRVAREAKLPLAGGAFLVDPEKEAKSQKPASPATPGLKVAKGGPGDPFGAARQLVLDGDEEAIVAEVGRLLKEGRKPTDIMKLGLIAAMDIISPLFKAGTVFIPEVLLSARAMNLAVETLEPYLAAAEGKAEPKTIVLGTVFGDLHDIGKNMVSTMLRGAGFQVIDLGINVPDLTFVENIKAHKPAILGLSALLTTTMPSMSSVIASLSEAGLRDQVKVMVGGAPITAKFAADIGADGYSADAAEAVELARKLSLAKLS
ncbi:MAG: corrinoid protein [Deltaproteobacteria bacterium]|jgi:corrinoid protein of di/trimethylamine methyltransferase|nr:corrinoid protein [Deltaproteobacteria bacterium]